MFRFILCVPGVWLCTLICVPTSSVRADDLGQQVRSLLSNRCFACHGPDAAHREGGFRLDDQRSFLSPADSGELPVVPGRTEASEVWKRVSTDDADSRMPPPSFSAALTAAEKQLIDDWIESGATLPAHWSFVAPQRPELPPAAEGVAADLRARWAGPVDRFVLQTLQQHGLTPSREAERYELLRRVSLDLTGLPPTPADVDRFQSDARADAYERQVDRLLASPAFGEHWARKWLDLARYADSAGYADDPDRTIWAYRDWVIRAINQNMPIDQFTIEQIAGDLLPDPTTDQLIATAFHRNTLTNNEGGTNDEEFRNVAIVDRVNTTMAVWMGLTINCTQCHTHKYDPFTQEEYYKLFAIFNQSQDADRRDESPIIELFTDAQQSQLDQWRSRLSSIQSEITVPNDSPELAEWEQSLSQPSWQRLKPVDFKSAKHSDAQFQADQSLLVKPVAKLVSSDTQTIELEMPDANEPIQSLAVRTLPIDSLPGQGAGLGNGNFVLTDVQAELIPRAELLPEVRYIRLELPGDDKILALAEVQVFVGPENIAPKGQASQSTTAYEGVAARAIDGNTDGDYFKAASTTHSDHEKSPWWELQLPQSARIDQIVIWNRTDGDLQSRLDGLNIICLNSDRQEQFKQVIKQAPKREQVVRLDEPTKIRFSAAYADFSQTGFSAELAIDKDNKSGWAVGGEVDRSHLLSLIPDKPIDTRRAARLRLTMGFNAPYQDHILSSYAIEISRDQATREWVALSDEARKIHLLPLADRTPEQQRVIADNFAQNFAGSTAISRKERDELLKKIAAMKPATSVPIMRELPEDQRRPTFVQLRGDYKSHGDPVQPGVPAALHALPISVDRPSRLDLARWLVDSRNPLTARVWVNRMWESLFGLGIVRTSEEFGTQGEAPTHPQLLDWLAVEFVDSGWDMKALLRLLVTSQAYRQSSQATAELLSQDRDNVWLARGPRVRLSAEMIRDQALFASGLITHNMFGAPVQPPQPNLGLKAAFGGATDWSTSQGEDRYRRAIYTKWRRSSPYPAMATFDAPSREVCVLRRDATNTPLQALVTLNDPAFIEAAQALARHVALDNATENADDRRLQLAFQICTDRLPTESEIAALRELLTESRVHFESRPDQAHQLATDPLGDLPPGASGIELAAWTSVCNVIFNLDEVLMKR